MRLFLKAVLLSVPLLEFEKPTYEVSEPPDEESVTTLEVVVLRRGDQSTLVEVRCSTRDGSAIAGMDYDAHSQIITFLPGITIYHYNFFKSRNNMKSFKIFMSQNMVLYTYKHMKHTISK